MAAHFLSLTAGGGIPLFCKSRGQLKPLPFAVTGSLNGVNMFTSTHGVKLQSTCTDDSKIIWKTFQDSITLILVTQDDGASDTHFERILDYIFQAMVLLYGLDNISNIKNIERFKREIKISNQLIDYILELLDDPSFAELTNAVEIIAGPENNVLQNYLDTFCEAATSPYGCVLVGGHVAVGTGKWWELAAVELVLLSMLVTSLPKCSSRDIPVFLPVTSPDVPHRLLTFHLIQGVEVCVLCGPTPSLTELEREVDRFWRSSLDSLKTIVRNNPRIIPPNLSLDQNIQGLLVVNTEEHRCLCSVQPHRLDLNNKTVNNAETKKRKHILQAFYKQVIGKLWCPPETNFKDTAKSNKDNNTNTSTANSATNAGESQESSDLKNGNVGSPSQDSPPKTKYGDLHENLIHKVVDTYLVTDTHKCYALQSEARQIYVLYGPDVPTYAMRSITQKTLQTLVKEKCVQL